MRDEVTGVWRKLHNEDLRNLYSSPSVIRVIKPRKMGWVEHVTRVGIMILVGEPEGMRPLGRLVRWVDNIKMDLR
jgi:hypothetical protein